MSGPIIDQKQIDLYYEKKKDEVSGWLIEYTEGLKRVKEEQRERLLNYAEAISFKNAGECNAYAQQLTTISKKDKRRLEKYLQDVEWLPEDVTVGFLDNQLVVKMMPNTQAEEMIQAAFGSDEQEEGDSSGNQ